MNKAKVSRIVGVVSILLVVFGLGPAALGAIHTLVDGNSSATFDTGSNAGMYVWNVDGTDHVFKQWFWYRVGSAGPEASIDTLSLFIEGTTDTNFDGLDDTLFVKYLDRNAGFSIDLTFTLRGGTPGSNLSDIGELINITSLTEEPLDFHFFQYTDLDLGGTISDDTAALMNPNTVRQWDSTLVVSETVVTPPPSHWEIDVFPATLLKLNDGVADTLSDSTSPLGPTDVTWAFEWDFTLAPFGTFQVSKDKNMNLIPAPGAIVLGLIGLAVVGRIKRRFS